MIVLEGLEAKVDHLAFSPDGRALLATSWSNPKVSAVWRVPEGGRRALFRSFAGTEFGPDGAAVLGVTFSDWNLELHVGQMALPPLPAEFTAGTTAPRWLGNLNCLRLSPDHSRLVASRLGQELLWWSWPDFTPLATWNMELCGQWTVADLAFSPDGLSVAVFQHDGLTLHETATGQVRWTAEVKGNTNFGCVAWSPDDRLVAAGAGKRLRVFDASDGSRVVERTQPSKHFLDAEFTRDGRFLATVSNEATVKFFDTSSWAIQAELAWQVGGLRAVAFSRDGMVGAAGGDGKKVVLWDVDL